jgi:hypothetical protein
MTEIDEITFSSCFDIGDGDTSLFWMMYSFIVDYNLDVRVKKLIDRSWNNISDVICDEVYGVDYD